MLERSRICTDSAEFSQTRLVTFLNPYSFLKILESNVNLNRFDKICIDGIALKYFFELVYRGSDIQRLSFDFTSVATQVFEAAVSKNEHGYILGSDEDSNNAFLKKIADMFPGINVDGRSGYFDNAEAQTSFLTTLAASNYNYVVIGMGAVRQEEAAITLMNSGFAGRIYTCGGFIHQTAIGGGVYYPAWIDRCNLRFAYRMFKEPSTIRRYLFDYPKVFFFLFRNIGEFKH